MRFLSIFLVLLEAALLALLGYCTYLFGGTIWLLCAAMLIALSEFGRAKIVGRIPVGRLALIGVASGVFAYTLVLAAITSELPLLGICFLLSTYLYAHHVVLRWRKCSAS